MDILFSILFTFATLIRVQSETCPTSCKCGETFTTVECNGLTKLPDELPNSIEKFTCRSPSLETIKVGYFTDTKYPNLTTVHIIGGKMESVANDAFVGNKLRELIIKDCLLAYAPIFKLNSLMSLDLSGNNISSFYKDTFVYLSNLTKLYLQNNSIKTFKHRLFSNNRIEMVNMSNNPLLCTCSISELFQNFFSNVDEIAGNCLTKTPVNSYQFEVIRRLNGPCVYGTCQIDGCVCDEDHIGDNCQLIKPLCYKNWVCGEHGQCVEVSTTERICKCSIGYRGSFCAILLTNCSTSLCNLHGTCIWNEKGNFSCSCDAEYSGPTCERRNVHDVDKNKTVLALLVIFGIVCLILLLIIGSCCWWDRKLQKNLVASKNAMTIDNDAAKEDTYEDVTVLQNENAYSEAAEL